jgi:phage gp16-like protein
MKTYSQQKGRGNPITPRQIKIIHTIKGTLGMEDEAYRWLLQSMFGATSSKGLTWRQAESLIEDLQGKTGQPSPRKEVKQKALPFADLDGRPGMASGKQCRMIAAMWSEVSRAESAEAKMQALDRFVKRIAGVDSIRFLKGWQVEKVVKAINEMKKDKEVIGNAGKVAS